jgi:hypothetical protein
MEIPLKMTFQKTFRSSILSDGANKSGFSAVTLAGISE